MPKLMSTLVLGISTAAASSAGLILTATPNQATYSSGGTSAGTLALAVDLDAMPTGNIQFVTGPALSATPITISFVDQAGTTGPLPVITGTSTNSTGGWNPIIAATPTTFTAFNFSPQSLPPAELVGQVDFALPDGSTSGVFDVVVSAFSLDGVDMPSQSIGTLTVVTPIFADGFETGDTARWSDAVP